MTSAYQATLEHVGERWFLSIPSHEGPAFKIDAVLVDGVMQLSITSGELTLIGESFTPLMRELEAKTGAGVNVRFV